MERAAGLDALALGFVPLVLAELISLAKEGMLARWLAKLERTGLLPDWLGSLATRTKVSASISTE